MIGDRLKYIKGEKKDWDAFYAACYDDEPIYPIINLIISLSHKYIPVFCTGRNEIVRKQTVAWIREYMGSSFGEEILIMRPDGDFRHDTEVKPEQLHAAGIELSHIAFVLEDRNTMVARWRELGLTCLQVAEGDF